VEQSATKRRVELDMKIACIGEAMVELSLQSGSDQAGLGFAGDTLNTAIYLKRAAPSLEVAYVTRLGQDDFSTRLCDFIAAEEISVADIEVSETARVGLYAITTDEAGERSFTYWRETSAARDMFQMGKSVSFSVLEKFDLIYLSAISLAILPDWVRSEFYNWVTGYRANGGLVSFDSNYRPVLWGDAELARAQIGRMWEMVDIALPSVDDEMAVFGESDAQSVTERLLASGVRNGALKCGEAGPVSLGEPVTGSYPAAAKVIDTTAAGDSFNGGYLACHLTGGSQVEALRAGHDLACKVVGTRGAILPRMSGT